MKDTSNCREIGLVGATLVVAHSRQRKNNILLTNCEHKAIEFKGLNQ